LPSLLLYETFDRLRDKPRFQALVEKMGFTKVNPKAEGVTTLKRKHQRASTQPFALASSVANLPVET
jgi:hypothetical protein